MKPIYKYSTIALLIAIVGLLLFTQVEFKFRAVETAAAPPSVAPVSGGAADPVEKGMAELPKEMDFRVVAESKALRLKLDETTGHFIVEDKRNGKLWRSYPEPEHWEDESIGGAWRTHLRSPVMLQHINFAQRKAKPSDTNFLAAGGEITGVERVSDGFKLVYDMPSIGISIPVEVTLSEEYVQTKILTSEIKENDLSLIWVRLYPFFGSEHSVGQDGYLFIPDGSGALMTFKENSVNSNKIYKEPVYGRDYAFNVDSNSRQPVIMPVYGIKSGEKGMISVITEGEEYAEIVASPAGAFSQYNWVTAQMNYRSTYYQYTSRTNFYIAYNEDEKFAGDRTIRHYLLEEDKSDYVGMASIYRHYLMDEKGLKKLEVNNGQIPLHLEIIGADTQKGLLMDRYISGTTTSQAMQMVQRLYGLGVQNMSIIYRGWQQDGASAFGGWLPVDQRIGGNEGMKQFIDFAHTLNMPVYLEANYALNNTGKDGYSARYHGIRDLAGSVLQFTWHNGDQISYVSNQFTEEVLEKDIPEYEELGVDGLILLNTGKDLNTNYNAEYKQSRAEAKASHHRMFQNIKDALGNVQATAANMYVTGEVGHIRNLINDYSYDLFSDQSVPFAQITLHGLVSYTSGAANQRQQYEFGILKDIETGALPSFNFTAEPTEVMKHAYSLHPFSSHIEDWESTTVQEYQRFNQALGDVQDQFITGHRTLADQVKETTYANGKRIIVNYSPAPYDYEGRTVPSMDFIAVEGGAEG